MGAVLVAGSRVVVGSPNRYRNSPLIDYRHSTFHAEDAALRRARGAPVNAVFVARVNAALVPMLAMPCARCVEKLARAGVMRAFYTAGPNTVEMLEIPQAASLVCLAGSE
jgi:tRNA(Arg) A34 adenosine deaminase TadA